MEQISLIKIENKQIINCFDVAAKMEAKLFPIF